MSSLWLTFFVIGLSCGLLEAQITTMNDCVAMMDGKLPSFVPTGFAYSGVSRQYFVKAEVDEWDYIPSGWDNMRGTKIAQSPEAKSYARGASHARSTFLKERFVGYTGSNFIRKALNCLGLAFKRAEVGDMVEVPLMNDLQTPSVTMHSMRLTYTKASEAAIYWNDSISTHAAPFVGNGSAVAPSSWFTYKWLVTNASQPTNGNPTKLWSYHGDINLEYDVESGLFGPLIVYRSGQMMQTVEKYKEFVLMYAAIDEASSFLAATNVNRWFDAINGTNQSISPAVSSSAYP